MTDIRCNFYFLFATHLLFFVAFSLHAENVNLHAVKCIISFMVSGFAMHSERHPFSEIINLFILCFLLVLLEYLHV